MGSGKLWRKNELVKSPCLELFFGITHNFHEDIVPKAKSLRTGILQTCQKQETKRHKQDISQNLAWLQEWTITHPNRPTSFFLVVVGTINVSRGPQAEHMLITEKKILLEEELFIFKAVGRTEELLSQLILNSYRRYYLLISEPLPKA